MTVRKAIVRITDADFRAEPELPSLAEFGVGYSVGDVVEVEIHDEVIAVGEDAIEGTFHMSPNEYKVESWLP